jgi:putative MATE family efflux protein
VSRRLGAGDRAGALASGTDGLWLAAAVGAVLVVLGRATVPGLVDAFGAGPGASAAARTYLAVSLLGIPAMLVVLAATGVLRGLQDTRTPLVVAAAGFTGNAVLSFVLVHGPGPLPALGVAGSAWGTVAAQLAMAAWLVALVVRGARREGVPLRPRAVGIRGAAVAGVPLLLRTVTLRLALLATVWAAASTGTASLAAHQVVFTVWTFAAFVLDSLAIAAQALTGLRLGAGDAEGARATTRRMVRWGVGGGALLGALLAAASPWLPWLFSDDAAVRTGITVGLVVVGVTAPLAGYVFVLDGVLIGAGDGPYLAKAGVWALLGYLPLLAVVPAAGLTGTTGLLVLWLAFAGGYMAARALTLGLRARSGRWVVLGA